MHVLAGKPEEVHWAPGGKRAAPARRPGLHCCLPGHSSLTQLPIHMPACPPTCLPCPQPAGTAGTRSTSRRACATGREGVERVGEFVLAKGAGCRAGWPGRWHGLLVQSTLGTGHNADHAAPLHPLVDCPPGLTYNLARASGRYASRTVRGGGCLLRVVHRCSANKAAGHLLRQHSNAHS